MTYLKGTKEELEAYNEEVTIGENYQGGTTQWAEIIETEEGLYIAYNEEYPSELEKVEELTINN